MPAPKPAETSVVRFTGKAAGRASRDAGKRPKHPDAKLIEACIEYALQVSGMTAAFDVDPTDSIFAGPAAAKSTEMADLALFSACNPARTIDGMKAKAALIDIALKDWDGDLDDLRQEFLRSFANDIIRFQSAQFPIQYSSTAIVVNK